MIDTCPLSNPRLVFFSLSFSQPDSLSPLFFSLSFFFFLSAATWVLQDAGRGGGWRRFMGSSSSWRRESSWRERNGSPIPLSSTRRNMSITVAPPRTTAFSGLLWVKPSSSKCTATSFPPELRSCHGFGHGVAGGGRRKREGKKKEEVESDERKERGKKKLTLVRWGDRCRSLGRGVRLTLN